jgi:membrane protease YdiL (CAAX protease family)
MIVEITDKSAHPIALFLLFAFGLPILCLLVVKNISFFQDGTPNLLLYGFEAMTPSLSALLVVFISQGRAGVRHFFVRCYVNNNRTRYLILSIVIPLSILVATKLTFMIFTDATAKFITMIPPQKLLIAMWALIAEELGWRGFLLERINRKYGDLTTPLLIGVIWAVWHYHFFLSGTLTAPIFLFVIGCITESIGYYWITKRGNGNVVPASIWHFTGNLFFNLFSLSPEYNNGSNAPYLIFVVYTAVMAIVLLYFMKMDTRKTKSYSLQDCHQK